MTFWTTFDSPLGGLFITGDGESVSALYMEGQRHRPARDPGLVRDDARFAGVVRQLDQYFAGERRAFDVPVRPANGTQFQRSVWSGLSRIPYGETVSYGELAERIGRPGASRAVGLANGRNPVSIIVPCHRVIGSGGELTGYGGGIARKRWLLGLEAGRTFTLLDNERRPYESSIPGTLGGHRGNKVYGALDCAGALRWITNGHYVKQRVFFADEPAAIAAGYRPCARCMPERYREWKGAKGSLALRTRPGRRS